MVIAFIPFPTSVMSENGNHTATIFYALIMALTGVLLAVLWWHAAYKHRLIDPGVGNYTRWREAVGLIVIAAIFILSIGVSYIDEGLVRICWALILPASLVINLMREDSGSKSTGKQRNLCP